MNTLYEQIEELEMKISELEEARDSAREAGFVHMAEAASDFAQEIDCEMDPFVRELSELYAREREEVYWDNQRDL